MTADPATYRQLAGERTDHVLATCRCARHPDHPCTRDITQEDLRCDVCGGRAGYGDRCGSVVGFTGGDRYHLALRITVDSVAFGSVPDVQLDGQPAELSQSLAEVRRCGRRA